MEHGKHFKQVTPSQDVQKMHRDFLSRPSQANGRKSHKEKRRAGEAEAPYRAAMLELLSKQGNLKPPSTPQARLQPLTRPSPLFQPRTLPPLGSFTGWVDLPTTQTTSNNAWGESSTDSVYVEVNAGMEEGQGGSAQIFGYVGQYFVPATASPVGTLVQASAIMLVGCAEAWTTTNIFPFTWDSASLDLWVNLIILVYNSDWSQNLQTIGSAQATIYNNSSNSGSSNWTLPDPFTRQVGLNVSTVLESNSNFGVFAQVFASASAAGASTGALVPGSSATAWMRATLQSST